MPELPETPVEQSGGVDPDRLAQVQRFPPPWPGMPIGLEALSATERGWRGRRFGIDTPYYYTLSGFGETIPLYYGDLTGIDPVFAIPPTGEPPVSQLGTDHPLCVWDGGPPPV